MDQQQVRDAIERLLRSHGLALETFGPTGLAPPPAVRVGIYDKLHDIHAEFIAPAETPIDIDRVVTALVRMQTRHVRYLQNVANDSVTSQDFHVGDRVEVEGVPARVIAINHGTDMLKLSDGRDVRAPAARK